MYAELARDEIEQLEEQGVRLTPEEVIRLNGLALKCLSPVAECRRPRRIAWAGNTILREPSISQEEWIRDIIPIAAADETSAIWLRAFALSRDGAELWKLMDYKTISKAVKEWTHELTCTTEQLADALAFALFGNDESMGEIGGETALSREAAKLREGLPESDELEELLELCRATHIEVDREIDTVEKLSNILRTYRAEQSEVDDYRKRLRGRATAAFYSALDEIKKAHESEVGNGECLNQA